MISEQRKFEHLNAMGIELWQRKTLDIEIIPADPPTERSAQEKYLEIDFTQLTKQQIFLDIIRSMSLTVNDLSIENNVIKLPNLNWVMTEKLEINIDNKTLSTPEVKIIATSSTLKRLLWQTIQS